MEITGLNFITSSDLWPGVPRPMSAAEMVLAQRDFGKPQVLDSGVALVKIRGTMNRGGGFYSFGADTISITNAINAAANDPNVKGIMLIIDSPGGQASSMFEVADAVSAAVAVKPVIAHVDGIAASAAYYVAVHASAIFAERMNVIGSIGTFAVVEDLSGMAEKEGVKVHVVKSSKFKGAGVPGAPVSEDQLADVQRIVDTFFAEFVGAVERGRGMDTKTVMGLADGRVHIGEAAVDNGLIDGIQTFAQSHQGLLEMVNRTPGRDRLAASIEIRKASLRAESRRLGADANAEPDAQKPNGGKIK